VHTFSPAFFNEVLVSGSTETWYSGTGAPDSQWSKQLGVPNPLNRPGWPAFYDLGSFSDWYLETENTQTTPFAFWIFDDNATRIVGRHELQFGFHYRWDKLDTTPEQQYTQGEGIGSSIFTSLYDPTTSRTNPLATPRTGDNTSGTYLGLLNYYVQLGHPTFRLRSQEFALYFQDNIRVTPRLTLNLGLRYDYWPPYQEADNLRSSFDRSKKAIVLGADLETMYRVNATLPSVVRRIESLGGKFISYQEAGMPKEMYTVPKTEFGPRLGFAYRLSTGAQRWCCGAATGFRILRFRCAPGRQGNGRTRRSSRAFRTPWTARRFRRTASRTTACGLYPQPWRA